MERDKIGRYALPFHCLTVFSIKNFATVDEKDAEMHYHDGEDALVCGDKFDDTVEDNIKGESSELEKPTMEENSAPNQVELNKKEKEDIKNSKGRAGFTPSKFFVVNM